MYCTDSTGHITPEITVCVALKHSSNSAVLKHSVGDEGEQEVRNETKQEYCFLLFKRLPDLYKKHLAVGININFTTNVHSCCKSRSTSS